MFGREQISSKASIKTHTLLYLAVIAGFLVIVLYILFPRSDSSSPISSAASQNASEQAHFTFSSSDANDSGSGPSAKIAQVHAAAASVVNVPQTWAYNSQLPSQPVSQVGNQKVIYPGQFARARIVADGQSYLTTPNQLGDFQEINVGPKEKIQVQVTYPYASEGDQVAVAVEDGGHIGKDQMSEVASLDGTQSIQFQFQTTSQLGIYRIALRNGPDVKVLNFRVAE